MLFGFLRKGNETERKSEKIEKLEGLLHLHTLDTVDLIHEYYLERHRGQMEMEQANEGMLTVKLLFVNDVLKVDVLNANNIKAMDSNGTQEKKKYHQRVQYQRYDISFCRFQRSVRQSALAAQRQIPTRVQTDDGGAEKNPIPIIRRVFQNVRIAAIVRNRGFPTLCNLQLNCFPQYAYAGTTRRRTRHSHVYSERSRFHGNDERVHIRNVCTFQRYSIGTVGK